MIRPAHCQFGISRKPHRLGIFFGGEHAFGNQQQREIALVCSRLLDAGSHVLRRNGSSAESDVVSDGGLNAVRSLLVRQAEVFRLPVHFP
jgi:hypothetical protein